MQLPINLPKLGLSKDEAAEYCGVSVNTLGRHGPTPTKIGDRTIYDRRVLDLPGHRDRPVGPDTENLPLRPVTEVLAEAKNFRLPDEDNPEVQRWLREMGVGDADK